MKWENPISAHRYRQNCSGVLASAQEKQKQNCKLIQFNHHGILCAHLPLTKILLKSHCVSKQAFVGFFPQAVIGTLYPGGEMSLAARKQQLVQEEQPGERGWQNRVP